VTVLPTKFEIDICSVRVDSLVWTARRNFRKGKRLGFLSRSRQIWRGQGVGFPRSFWRGAGEAAECLPQLSSARVLSSPYSRGSFQAPHPEIKCSVYQNHLDVHIIEGSDGCQVVDPSVPKAQPSHFETPDSYQKRPLIRIHIAGIQRETAQPARDSVSSVQAHGLLYHSTQGSMVFLGTVSRVIKKTKKVLGLGCLPVSSNDYEPRKTQ
jgi:hypothetical protein